jgi:spermidine synthase
MEKAFITEPLAEGVNRQWEISDLVFDQSTKYQHVRIGRTSQGITLFCNQERQSNEITQQIYHEGQLIPGVLLSKSIENVLVIGSSEGVVCQMAVELGAKNVVHVDIDEECVRACAQYLPYGYSNTDISRALSGEDKIKLVFQDGRDFVKQSNNDGIKYNLVVVDLPDEDVLELDAQQNFLYSELFLEDIRSILADDGVFISQAGCPTYWRNTSLRKMWLRSKKIFETVVYFEMEEQDWAWIVGMKDRCELPIEFMQKKLATLIKKPCFIDHDSIFKSTIPPISIRSNICV